MDLLISYSQLWSHCNYVIINCNPKLIVVFVDLIATLSFWVSAPAGCLRVPGPPGRVGPSEGSERARRGRGTQPPKTFSRCSLGSACFLKATISNFFDVADLQACFQESASGLCALAKSHCVSKGKYGYFLVSTLLMSR